MLIASLVALIGQAGTLLTMWDRNLMITLTVCTLATGGLFVSAALRNFSLAEKGLYSVDLLGSKGAWLISILVLVFSVATQSVGMWLALCLGASLSTWMCLFGFYLQRRARSVGAGALPIIWYVAILTEILALLAILLLSVELGDPPRARLLNHASVKEMTGVFLMVAVLLGILITPLSVACFGFTWEILKHQMRSGLIPDLDPPRIAVEIDASCTPALSSQLRHDA
ncbi:MAG: hypothetical protein U0744_15645 [Gemmataceae bacterium]